MCSRRLKRVIVRHENFPPYRERTRTRQNSETVPFSRGPRTISTVPAGVTTLIEGSFQLARKHSRPNDQAPKTRRTAKRERPFRHYPGERKKQSKKKARKKTKHVFLYCCNQRGDDREGSAREARRAKAQSRAPETTPCHNVRKGTQKQSAPRRENEREVPPLRNVTKSKDKTKM